MNSTVRRSVAVTLLVFSVSCGSSRPTSPSGTNQPPSVSSPTPQPPINFPPLSGPSRTFIFDGELSYRVRDFTRNSRFVLYDNGAFVLQYPPSSLGDGAFRGQYQVANGIIMFLFEFQGRSAGTPFDDATGTLKGDSLTVQYPWSMRMADFEDAVYVLMP
jgi:hypothetical protein